MQIRRWQYWFRLVTFFIITLTLALLCLPIFLGAFSMLGLLYAPCTQNRQTPADYGFSYEPVVIEARAGGSFRGYFVPGTNGAAIIMPPPFTSGRNVRLPEMEMLARHGYSVFDLESRRCAGMGPLSLGYKEVDDVGDVLDYLLSRPDVDPERIGVHGFSSAGATSIMAAARYPQLKAVVAEGGYGDFTENALGSGRERGLNAWFLSLFRWASYVTYRLVTGLDINTLSPVSVIYKISPRPVLLIYGSKEVSLPGGRRQKTAAGDNAELWVVEGAGHGNYLRVAPEVYKKRIVAFFDKAFFP
jgi:pimeloyl-ACP methyl ester carboxylesterase